jgi:hypothetical protein
MPNQSPQEAAVHMTPIADHSPLCRTHMNLRAFSKWIVAASALFIACAASYHIGRTSGMRDEQARWITRYTPTVRFVPHLGPPEPTLRAFERLSFQIDWGPHGTLNIVESPFPAP